MGILDGNINYEPANYSLTGTLNRGAGNTQLFGQNWGDVNTGITPPVNVGYTPPSYSIGQGSGVTGFGNMVGDVGTGSVGTDWMGSLSKWFGGTNADGTKGANVGGNIIGSLGTLANLGLAWGSYKDTKKNNAFNRDMVKEDLAMSKQAYNTKMEARKRASEAANPGGDYSFYKPVV